MAGGRLWTSSEDDYLRAKYVREGRKACALYLGRGVNGVAARAYALGIQGDVAWTPDEDALLRDNYSVLGRNGCQELLPNRTVSAVGARAGFLGFTASRHSLSKSEKEIIRAHYPQRGGRKRCAELLPHLTSASISHFAERLGVLQRSLIKWTRDENAFLRDNYPSKGKFWCSGRLTNRTPGAVLAQAVKLGLEVDPKGEYFKGWQMRAAASKKGKPRPAAGLLLKKLWAEGRMKQPTQTSERRAKHAGYMRDRHARLGNPNKGKHLSSETKQKMSAASLRMWDDPSFRAKMMTEERWQQRRLTSSENWSRSLRANENAYSRCKKGRRLDLDNTFFRSKWEANYARILNHQVKLGQIFRWEYEADSFRFPAEERYLSYMPDFKLWRTSKAKPHYVEIKGFMDEKSRIKLQLMKAHHPNIKIRLIEQRDYKALEEAYSSQLPHWEE